MFPWCCQSIAFLRNPVEIKISVLAGITETEDFAASPELINIGLYLAWDIILGPGRLIPDFIADYSAKMRHHNRQEGQTNKNMTDIQTNRHLN